MQQPLPPWWAAVHEAAHLLASQLNAAVAHAAKVGVYTPPPGSPPPRRRRRPASLRHLAEVIRSRRLAPGVSADKDDVAAVLSGEPRPLTNAALVVAVARAGHLIAGVPFEQADADRLAVASAHVAALIERARQADERVPHVLPVPVSAGGSPVTGQPPPAAPPVVIDAYFTTRRPRRRWPLTAGVLAAVLLAGAAAILVARDGRPQQQPPPAPAATAAPAVIPLSHGQADTDPRSTRPVQDALAHGFTSLRTEVALRDGTLVRCSPATAAGCAAQPFEPAFLQALHTRVQAGGGRVYPGYHQPVLLFVDIGCTETPGGACALPADPAAAATDPNNPLVVARTIIGSLVPYRDMLFHVDAGARQWGAVQVVLSGDHTGDLLPADARGSGSVRTLLAAQTDRYAFLDGSFALDRDQYNADLVPVISFTNPATTGHCAGQAAEPIQKLRWDDITAAQRSGHHVRTLDLLDCPDHSDAWTDALYGGVDIIGSRQPALLADWLRVNAAGGGGGGCTAPAWIPAARLFAQHCTLSSADVAVLSRPDPTSARVGTLPGAGPAWFLGQQPGEPDPSGGTHNFWWAYTRAGNGQWGWVSLVHFADPGLDQSADGLQYGCYDVRPGESDDCHPL
ncbi:hypothetical protein [Actinoplanes sp. N902-109]|uniref:hypothetical protein n=1 Tax=Actinoplanes sp. (strain N902-109) TaxID=649831 RepID=UPI000329384D|nr:hypothetical protein [Actinoplanes sp. N902-109]AGL17464.1 hypothetical protein L083_3954 [Actinoplanes sp. N902-109]